MSNEKDPEMIPVSFELAAPFYNFLKDYVEFFGSKMTVNDLVQQMAYEEARRLHVEITAFILQESGVHYVGHRGWFNKYREVALTTGTLPEEPDVMPDEPPTEEDPENETVAPATV